MQAALLCRGAHAAAAAGTAALPALLATAGARVPGLLTVLASSAGETRRRLFTSPWAGSSHAHSHGHGASSGTTNAGSGAGGAAESSDVGQLHVTVEPLSGAHEGVSVISLSRPAARNAIGRQLLRELAEALDTVRQERTTRCVLVRSVVPGVFCAGADLKERATMSQSEAAEFVSRIRRTFTELQDLPMPTVAVVEGLALGGGAELALACDIRVMGSDASMAFPEAQLGIIPGAGGTQRLPRIVGASRAKELIFTGRRVSGAEALALQLADHVVPDDQVSWVLAGFGDWGVPCIPAAFSRPVQQRVTSQPQRIFSFHHYVSSRPRHVAAQLGLATISRFVSNALAACKLTSFFFCRQEGLF
ncbi:hypothetical protein PLESTB_001247800 [Pleodorina starrii]|uniref:Uncharacterized protein n=1 Tax=Pleodorina starrii TaxID=330485 RepID=A0A9W6F617_9CHLO|nr:hypothetical protein PLESTB_001247800 [Pleodorina starrii]